MVLGEGGAEAKACPAGGRVVWVMRGVQEGNDMPNNFSSVSIVLRRLTCNLTTVITSS